MDLAVAVVGGLLVGFVEVLLEIGVRLGLVDHAIDKEAVVPGRAHAHPDTPHLASGLELGKRRGSHDRLGAELVLDLGGDWDWSDDTSLGLGRRLC